MIKYQPNGSRRLSDPLGMNACKTSNHISYLFNLNDLLNLSPSRLKTCELNLKNLREISLESSISLQSFQWEVS